MQKRPTGAFGSRQSGREGGTPTRAMGSAESDKKNPIVEILKIKPRELDRMNEEQLKEIRLNISEALRSPDIDPGQKEILGNLYNHIHQMIENLPVPDLPNPDKDEEIELTEDDLEEIKDE